jgi:hypothetical protein
MKTVCMILILSVKVVKGSSTKVPLWPIRFETGVVLQARQLFIMMLGVLITAFLPKHAGLDAWRHWVHSMEKDISFFHLINGLNLHWEFMLDLEVLLVVTIRKLQPQRNTHLGSWLAPAHLIKCSVNLDYFSPLMTIVNPFP